MASAHRFRAIYRTPIPKLYFPPPPPPPTDLGLPGQDQYQSQQQEEDFEPPQQYQINSQNHLLEPVYQQSSVDYQQRTQPIKRKNPYQPPQPTFTPTAQKRKRGESKKKAIQKDLDRIFNF